MVGSLGGRAPLFADSDEAFLGSAAFNFPTKRPGKGLPWQSSGQDSPLPMQGGSSSIPDEDTKIPHAVQRGQK